jgi:hypothetical protein
VDWLHVYVPTPCISRARLPMYVSPLAGNLVRQYRDCAGGDRYAVVVVTSVYFIAGIHQWTNTVLTRTASRGRECQGMISDATTVLDG